LKTFHCQFCGNPVFFENVSCLRCGSELAFLPDRMSMAAIEQVPSSDALWRPRTRGKRAPSADRYRRCRNTLEHKACNFVIPERDPNAYCVSCRLTRVLPDLSQPANRSRWYATEIAKRRLFYTLAKLGLISATPDAAESDGPEFQFLADLPGNPVITGHCNGVITLNVVEADDAERIKRRLELHEPYRTLLGHLRHESGHYYWDRLIAGRAEDSFRALFGDERQDYAEALKAYYANGAEADWLDFCVSAYATAHPWEDWAETWAHYLHMVDLLETAASYNTSLSVGDDEGVEEVTNPFETGLPDFQALVDQWVPVTLLVNSLNRSLGQEDAYPFALSSGALKKLRYVHETIGQVRQAGLPQAGARQDAAPCRPDPAPTTA
jgi:hypothetical protein